ncbi:hypothetical protein K431DRAFT_290680 [Polychaeton citri CBS 116435]|uniref:Uncharacterized protein n=1 Tax=Polychaeton citri CBS 116435 TaxID=1314669 RepID=A0A9P4QIL4_9PEZI|nr:hypothetical protein K431DRAFT_290680 [Polychaeton citri CBS 116435]
MARYPTVEEYNKNPTKAQAGVKRCDDFLKKSPNDIKLLTTKLQLLYIASPESTQSVLDQIAKINPPPTEIEDLTIIEDAVVRHSRQGVYPTPDTAGPQVSELWEKAIKLPTVSYTSKLDLMSIRFQRAVVDNRRQDVQQTLIQLKKWAEGNRVVYLAHAAATQLLSKEVGKDLPGRLALGLAKKAIKDGFDAEKGLDCRVVGQILALQEAKEELETIKGKDAFIQSGLVYQALGKWKKEGEVVAAPNGEGKGSAAEVDMEKFSSDEKISTQSDALQDALKDVLALDDVPALEEFAAKAAQLFYTSTRQLSLKRPRTPAKSIFLAISALVQASFAVEAVSSTSDQHLLQATFLAEQLLAYSEHLHEAKLVLVYLYQYLGLGSLAATHYAALNIKEVQFDTVGHTLFADIATSHPHPISITASVDTKSKSTVTFDPLGIIVQSALSFYQRCENRLADCEADILTHGQTGMIFELHELRGNLRDSITRRLFELEQRRIARLTGAIGKKATRKLDRMPLSYWGTAVLKDTRDFNAAFNFGVNVERKLHNSLDPRIRLLYRLSADCAWSLSQGEPSLVLDVEELLAEVSNLPPTSLPSLDDRKADVISVRLEVVETLVAELSQHLLRALNMLVTAPSTLSTTQTEVINAAIDRLDVKSLLISSPASAAISTIPIFFAYADATLLSHAAAAKLAQGSSAPGKPVPAEVSQAAKAIQARSRKLFDELQARAKELKAVATSAKVRESLFANAEGVSEQTTLLLKVLEGLDAKSFVEKVSQAATAGWESFGKVRLP